MLFPFLFSFHKGMRWIKHFQQILLSFIIVSVVYLSWDIYFTKHAIWGFNLDYCLGITLGGMPIEEYLFFICIPYASLFIHYVFDYYYPNVYLNTKITQYLSFGLILLALIMALIHHQKAYTFFNFLILFLSLILAMVFNFKALQKYFITYLFILIPFIVVNGILTGSFVQKPIVWYNNTENLAIRIFTIPIEDFAYAFSLLLLNLLLIEFFTKRKIAKS